MKLGFRFFLLAFLFCNTMAFGRLDTEDFAKINTMFRESEKRTQEYIDASEKRVQEYIDASEKRTQAALTASEKRTQAALTASEVRMKERVGHENAKVIITMDETDKRVSGQLDRNFTLTIALIALIGVIIGLPYWFERKKERELDEKIAAQQRQIDELEKKIDTLTRGQTAEANPTEVQKT
ncbi:hypothetical protein C6495_10375 [Candidatus Poribacteria bacterium]|nr:MAG: hypothetical protein C6495_10375 [Candidatus Poribacteria bacterium]